MASFTISFRLHYDTVGGRTYQDRLAALDATVKNLSTVWWAQTTSFYAISTHHSIDEIVRSCRSVIAPSQDLLLVLDADQKAGRITGKNDDADIYKVIPYITPV